MPVGRRDSHAPAHRGAAAGPREATHVLVLVEDITLPKRLERQMLLTERLTTAGRLAAGVAHELNNPLATIAGCAEALQERRTDPHLAGLDAFQRLPELSRARSRRRPTAARRSPAACSTSCATRAAAARRPT